MKILLLSCFVLCAAAMAAAQSSHDADPGAQKTATPVKVGELSAHPVVALTFDDLPAAGSLPPGENRTKILTALAAELKANHLEGTYGFVNAVKLENDPDAQQALHVWLDAGMNVGSHTWSHISLTANTAEAFEEEIAKNEPALESFGQLPGLVGALPH